MVEFLTYYKLYDSLVGELTIEFDPVRWCQFRYHEAARQEDTLRYPPLGVPRVSMIMCLPCVRCGEEHD